MQLRDTIFALSSGSPPAAIGVIRISGDQALGIAGTLCGSLPPPRRAGLRRLIDPMTGDMLDEALVLVFPGDRSATGEPLVELQCHGGRAIVGAVLGALGRQPGARAARPGEFTRRALENGRIDLNMAEGLGDLLAAETEAQRRAAMAMVAGAFSHVVESVQAELLLLSARLEAALDFDDEGDVPTDVLASISGGIHDVSETIDAQLASPPAERLREGIRVVIAGPTNAGKSTLFNALVGRDAAIVTDIAGTTRDRLEMPVVLDGTAYLFTDTAGLRDAALTDTVERIGMDRAREALAAADILLWLGPADERPRDDAVVLLTQVDRPEIDRAAPHDLAISVHSGEGMTDLRALIAARAATLIPAETGYALSARQREALESIAAELAAAATLTDPLLIAEHLRLALGGCDRLTGRASTEHVLDRLFAGFCIGK